MDAVVLVLANAELDFVNVLGLEVRQKFLHEGGVTEIGWAQEQLHLHGQVRGVVQSDGASLF